MGEALHLTLRLATGGYVGLTPPLLLVLKIVPSLLSCRSSKFTATKGPRPPCTEMGPICAGPTLLPMIEEQKISTRATRTAAEKHLTGSFTTRSNFQSRKACSPSARLAGATVQT